ncbi:MAG: O-antigen ligase family protein [Rhizobiaceae bacterium]
MSAERDKAKDWLGRRIAQLSFLVLFPGFFLWQAALLKGLTPLSINLFAEASVAALLLFVAALLPASRKVFSTPVFSTCLFVMMAWCGLWTLGTWMLAPDVPPGAIVQVVITYMNWIVLIMIGLFLDVDDRAFRRALWLAIIACFIIALVNFDGSTTKFSDDPEQSVYQGLARSVALSAAVLIAGFRDGFARVVLIVLALGFLFIVGARSELAAMTLAFGGYELIRLFLRPSGLKTIVPCIVIGALALLFWRESILAAIQDSRQLQLLDLEDSTSWQARQMFSEYAWATIEAHPIAGEFGSHFNVPVEESEQGGAYAHSILSAWVSFGLVGFILYLTPNVIAVAMAARQAFARTTTSLWRMAFYMTVSSMILLVAAKPIFWPTPAIGWGLIIAAYSGARRRQTGVRNVSAAAPRPIAST